MKTLFAAALVASTALTGAAHAMTTAPAGQIAAIQAYAPNADLSDLTAADIGTLLSVIHGGDSEGNKRGFVQAYVQ